RFAGRSARAHSHLPRAEGRSNLRSVETLINQLINRPRRICAVRKISHHHPIVCADFVRHKIALHVRCDYRHQGLDALRPTAGFLLRFGFLVSVPGGGSHLHPRCTSLSMGPPCLSSMVGISFATTLVRAAHTLFVRLSVDTP